jgi:hypothetical protein
MPNNPLLLRNGYLHLGPGELTAIIVGCQMDEATIKRIRSMIREHDPSVAIRFATRSRNKYQLTIEQ